MTRTVNVIGAGRIGAPVIAWLRQSDAYALGRVLTRSGETDTGDAELFFGAPADIIIETAGPDALRVHGPRALHETETWTVSGGALADDAFRRTMEAIGRTSGHRLRLFSHWIAAADHASPGTTDRLRLRTIGPGLGADWSGTLAEAARRYPDTVNSVVSAALCGPGLEAATIDITDTGPNSDHRIEAVLDTAFGRFETRLRMPGPHVHGPHPTAAALIAALRRQASIIQYG